MTPADPHGTARFEALLLEGEWLRRLARGLLADPGDAEGEAA